MAPEHLPRVRELSGLASNMVMLRSVGAMLRLEYSGMLDQHVPDHLSALVGQLSQKG
jgi:hypothetical protein